MIYPTRLAVLAAAAGAPVALLVAMQMADLWYAALAWPALVLVGVLVDAIGAIGARDVSVILALPRTASVGEEVEATVTVTMPGRGAPRRAEVAIASDALVDLVDDGRATVSLDKGRGAVVLPVETRRRGTARFGQVWVRWRGPLGLAWKGKRVASDASLAILPDIRPVHERGARIFQRHALQGLMTQLDRGDGTDFDTLVEFRSGMDRRAIDWKQSARHLKLHAKEYRTERNNQIVFAVDSGRQMSEPVAGVPRIDRAVAAMLLTGWVALKLGDRVALHSFDSRPRIASGLISGAGAFPELQRLAARIDYSGDETNYTYALTTLAARLTRRSMIVLFTEFTDLTSADFMIRATARLAQTHLLMVVVLRDEELEAIVDRAPRTSDDITRAVTAAALLKDRLLALTRLRHLGAHVIESEYDKVGDWLVQGYVDLKRRNLL
ncbi:DUF58 domain-containing protein [Sphingomonas bacterium]|uniref:DUF58 domain-containing protein n=1 Tax=Sphingomonas bacterium TaxID=1895847 RepID=UPI00262D7DAE|nr:DUF58 domain-containing protein [Sphingomonas bacterium]MDB5677863.1 hypothetical protein [Sphingomonas bacterium]